MSVASNRYSCFTVIPKSPLPLLIPQPNTQSPRSSLLFTFHLYFFLSYLDLPIPSWFFPFLTNHNRSFPLHHLWNQYLFLNNPNNQPRSPSFNLIIQLYPSCIIHIRLFIIIIIINPCFIPSRLSAQTYIHFDFQIYFQSHFHTTCCNIVYQELYPGDTLLNLLRLRNYFLETL